MTTTPGVWQWNTSIDLENRWMLAGSCASANDWREFSVYPRLLQLARTGHVMFIDGYNNRFYAPGEGPCPSGPGVPCEGRYTAFMELSNLCAESGAQFRWRINKPSMLEPIQNAGAQTAHYVTYDSHDEQTYFATVRDSVYRVSGGERESCVDHGSIFAETLVMQNPAASDTGIHGSQWEVPTYIDAIGHPRRRSRKR